MSRVKDIDHVEVATLRVRNSVYIDLSDFPRSGCMWNDYPDARMTSYIRTSPMCDSLPTLTRLSLLELGILSK